MFWEVLAAHPRHGHPGSDVLQWKEPQAGNLRMLWPLWGICRGFHISHPSYWEGRIPQLPAPTAPVPALNLLLLPSLTKTPSTFTFCPLSLASSICNQLVSISSPQIHSFNKYWLSTDYARCPCFTTSHSALHPHFPLKLPWTRHLFIVKPMVTFPGLSLQHLRVQISLYFIKHPPPSPSLINFSPSFVPSSDASFLVSFYSLSFSCLFNVDISQGSILSLLLV